jgi:cellulose synthase/poly-beta-1,6-N-acetylglucosamine synthase-like glycosyltransferase
MNFEFIEYWTHMGWGRFTRVFWYFLIFDFSRFILLDVFVLIRRGLLSDVKKDEDNLARSLLLREMPFVSIIVPGKNEGKHLYRLMQTMKTQTYQNFEVIFVDDGSDDHTPLIAKSCEKQFSNLRYFRSKKNGGKASAANYALRMATGVFIVALDADCSFEDDAIEKILLPFYKDKNVGGVGGDVKIRDWEGNLCLKLQAFEYILSISLGRIVSSQLGIYRIISGAFGAFRASIVDQVGGYDHGPGTDGDITVKIRKSGYKIVFQPDAICYTTGPGKFMKLSKQRLRWSKSIVRFRMRKHKDVFYPNANFKMLNFLSSAENILYCVIFDFFWWYYIIEILILGPHSLKYILPMNFLLYSALILAQFILALFLSNRPKKEITILPYFPLMSIYNGTYMRVVRTIAYLTEIFFKDSFNDLWNPRKSSFRAKQTFKM